jgi:hypothetical protein
MTSLNLGDLKEIYSNIFVLYPKYCVVIQIWF